MSIDISAVESAFKNINLNSGIPGIQDQRFDSRYNKQVKKFCHIVDDFLKNEKEAKASFYVKAAAMLNRFPAELMVETLIIIKNNFSSGSDSRMLEKLKDSIVDNNPSNDESLKLIRDNYRDVKAKKVKISQEKSIFQRIMSYFLNLYIRVLAKLSSINIKEVDKEVKRERDLLLGSEQKASKPGANKDRHGEQEHLHTSASFTLGYDSSSDPVVGKKPIDSEASKPRGPKRKN